MKKTVAVGQPVSSVAAAFDAGHPLVAQVVLAFCARLPFQCEVADREILLAQDVCSFFCAYPEFLFLCVLADGEHVVAAKHIGIVAVCPECFHGVTVEAEKPVVCANPKVSLFVVESGVGVFRELGQVHRFLLGK